MLVAVLGWTTRRLHAIVGQSPSVRLGSAFHALRCGFCGSGWWVFSVQDDSAGWRCCSEQGADPWGRVLASDRAEWEAIGGRGNREGEVWLMGRTQIL